LYPLNTVTKAPTRLLWLKCCRASQETASPARLYVAGAAIAVMSIVDWLIIKGWVPFLAPLGIALVIGTVIAAFADRTSLPSAGDDTTGGPTESLPKVGNGSNLGAGCRRPAHSRGALHDRHPWNAEVNDFRIPSQLLLIPSRFWQERGSWSAHRSAIIVD